MWLRSLLVFMFLTGAVQAQEDVKNTLYLTVSSQTVSVVAGEECDVKLTLKGTTPVGITFVPIYEPPDSANIVYPLPNVTVEPGVTDWETNVLVKGQQVGQVVVIWTAMINDLGSFDVDINPGEAFTIFSVVHSATIEIIGYIIGWSYFVLWSLAYWPQFYENWRRKSVIGLNFDYVILNALGNITYVFFNASLYWSLYIQAQYKSTHPYGVLQVEFNDVVYALHASILCILTGIQCCIYERGKQKMSWLGIGCSIASVLILVASIITAGAGAFTWLGVLYVCSYIKLASTLVKNCPQVYMNYKRKSTKGWSISGAIMDFLGGICSILQMFLLAYNSDDWDSLFGNPAKFLLGLVSVAFDVVFILQHYVLYRHPVTKKPTLRGP